MNNLLINNKGPFNLCETSSQNQILLAFPFWLINFLQGYLDSEHVRRWIDDVKHIKLIFRIRFSGVLYHNYAHVPIIFFIQLIRFVTDGKVGN